MTKPIPTMTNKPLILDFIESRDELENFPAIYKYDYIECLNLVNAEGKKKPFIDCDLKTLELSTKTRVRQEQDDDRNSLELETKTKVRSEGDDFFNPLLEITTKTFVKHERDDENFDNYK